MSRYCSILLLCFFALPFWLLPARAQNARVVHQIQITSTFREMGGWHHRINPGSGPSGTKPSGQSEPDRVDLFIRRAGDAYYLDDKLVDASLISALVKALSAPPNPELNLDDLGVTPEWLKANASSVAHRLAESRIVNGGPVHEAMLESAFADPATMGKVVPRLFNNDDYRCADCSRPVLSATVSVNFEDFTSVVARSSSRFPYMLPWRVPGNGTEQTAYNADISRAIAALMPEKATNRSRLAGENFATALGKAVLMDVEHQAQMLDVESKTSGTLSALRSRYTVEQASIGNFGDPVLRRPEQTEPDGPGLLLRMQPPDLPHVIDDEVVLPYVNGSVEGADKFLQDASQFEKLVLAVPWLSQYKQENPRVQLRLAFFRSASLTDDALKAFAADMHEVGRDSLVPKVEAVKQRIAVLVAGFGAEESDWLVLPDQRMILWRYWQTPIYGKPTLLKFGPANFDAKPCAKLQSNFVHCVGAEISSEGILQH
jgi:hypothetical protein